jgi:hypothetical protein
MKHSDFYWMSEFNKYCLRLAQNEIKIIGMHFNLLFKDKQLFIHRKCIKCINRIYVKFNSASININFIFILFNLYNHHLLLKFVFGFF